MTVPRIISQNSQSRVVSWELITPVSLHLVKYINSTHLFSVADSKVTNISTFSTFLISLHGDYKIQVANSLESDRSDFVWAVKQC